MFARVIGKVRQLAECDLEGLSALDDFLSALLGVQGDRRARGTTLALLRAATDVFERSAAWAHEEEGLT
jgi:hypothetical protein